MGSDEVSQQGKFSPASLPLLCFLSIYCPSVHGMQAHAPDPRAGHNFPLLCVNLASSAGESGQKMKLIAHRRPSFIFGGGGVN